MLGNRIIVHALIKINGKYLVIKRSKEENVYPEYYDIPGGMVELGELPLEALSREVKEEVNLKIKNFNIIHEDSNYDKKKDKVFIRLVYLAELDCDINEMMIDKAEHSEYLLVNNLNEVNDKVVPYLEDILKNIA